ncbi:hypothetical protein Q3G72_015085 [Acer saccharum]|nr:hypothetical protein Q3G72_015085 [Acer saccharum]
MKRTGYSVDGLERSLQAASLTREKWPRRRRGVDGLERTVSAVGGVDWQGGGSDGRWSPKRKPKRERDLILKFLERDLILTVEKNEETFGY